MLTALFCNEEQQFHIILPPSLYINLFEVLYINFWLSQNSAQHIGVERFIYCGRKKTSKLQVHPYRPVSCLPTHQGI